LVVGQIAGAHGLRGEIKVKVLTDSPQRFGQLDQVFLGRDDEEPSARTLEGYRMHKSQALLQIEGCRDRAAAQALRGLLVQVPLEEAIPLGEDEYFEHQILGLSVWTVEDVCLGTIEEIIYTGANEVYVVQDSAPGQPEVLIPAISDVVLDIDLDAGRLTVSLLEGLT
jgi:16S rRNA processing protein RimM